MIDINLNKVILWAVLIMAFMTTASEAGWLIYYEPEFKGRVIDIDSKQPVEGAVVVALYRKSTMGLGAGSISSLINTQETMTDTEGNFHIPSYTTFIQPFSKQISNSLIIFKPGYASIELHAGYFAGKEWKEYELSWPDPELRMLKCRLQGHGIIELPKLKTKEQRLKALYPVDISGAEISEKKLPLLYKSINSEKTSLGIR